MTPKATMIGALDRIQKAMESSDPFDTVYEAAYFVEHVFIDDAPFEEDRIAAKAYAPQVEKLRAAFAELMKTMKFIPFAATIEEIRTEVDAA